MSVRASCLEAYDGFLRGIMPQDGFVLLLARGGGAAPRSWSSYFFTACETKREDNAFILTGIASMVDVAIKKDGEKDSAAAEASISVHGRSKVPPVEISYPRGLGYSLVFIDSYSVRTDLESFLIRVLAQEGGLEVDAAEKAAIEAVAALFG